MLANHSQDSIPKLIKDAYSDFKKIRKSSAESNYLSFRAKSKIDEKYYTIRLLNIEGDLYKTNKSLSIKMYLQELFYLSAKFGQNLTEFGSSEEILLFQNFEVGDNGSMAFVMKDSMSLSELLTKETPGNPVCIDDFVREAYMDVQYINSTFGISNLELNFDSINCFKFENKEELQSKNLPLLNYFITDWNSGVCAQTPIEIALGDSIISDLGGFTTKFDACLSPSISEHSAVPIIEQLNHTRDYFAPEELKSSSLKRSTASEVYCIGLLALEIAGMPKNRWKDLVRIEDPKNYDLILDSIVQSLASDYNQSEKLCNFISNMLKKEPDQRASNIKDKFQRKRAISVNFNEFTPSYLEQQHAARRNTESDSISKILRTKSHINMISSTQSLARTSDEDLNDFIEKNLDSKGSERKKHKIKILEDTYVTNEELSLAKNHIEPLERDYQKKLTLERDRYSKLISELQVQLLTILEKLYGEKLPSFQVTDAEICVRTSIKLILKKVIADAQSHYKKMHSDVRVLFDSPTPIDIKQVMLSSKAINDQEAAFFAKNAKWADLAELYLHNNFISDRGIADITENKSWSNLEILDLRGNLISDEGAIKIGLNQSWPSLQQLWLYQNRISDEGAIAIVNNTTWKKLECLDLARNFVSDEGAVAIGENTTWKLLRTLQLYENEIGDRGAIALANNKTWKNLTELDLEKNKISYDGAVALAANTTWTHLERLYLSGNRLEQKAIDLFFKDQKWKNTELVLYYEELYLGEACYMCKKSLHNTLSQCFNYEKRIHYCFECIKKEEESTFLGMKFRGKKYIDQSALIFIDVKDPSDLSKVLGKRIGSQMQPTNDCDSFDKFNYHDICCDACMTVIGKKIRWKCLNCKNVDLCHKCHLLLRKKDMSTIVTLKMKGHDVESHILQRYIFAEEN